jgi:hypothetical protein
VLACTTQGHGWGASRQAAATAGSQQPPGSRRRGPGTGMQAAAEQGHTVAAGAAGAPMARPSAQASSKAWLQPWPSMGVARWAASPVRATRPLAYTCRWQPDTLGTLDNAGARSSTT